MCAVLFSRDERKSFPSPSLLCTFCRNVKVAHMLFSQHNRVSSHLCCNFASFKHFFHRRGMTGPFFSWEDESCVRSYTGGIFYDT